MTRPAALCAAALLTISTFTAARGDARAAGPFPEVPLGRESRASTAWAWGCMGSGLALIGASTVLARRANDRYAAYEGATEPARVEELYDETVALDRWSTGTLLTGEALIATGLYLRFLRRPPPARMALDVGPARCALVLRF